MSGVFLQQITDKNCMVMLSDNHIKLISLAHEKKHEQSHMIEKLPDREHENFVYGIITNDIK